MASKVELEYTPPPPPLSALSAAQRLLLHRLLKNLQRHRGLIIWHLMPGPKHPQKAQIIHRLDRAPLRPVHRIRRQRLGRERAGAGITDRVGGREPAEPIADPIRVAGPEDDADAALDDGGEGGEEVAGVVACGGEFVVGGVWAFCVCRLGSYGAGDGGLEEVARVGGRGVRVVARFADVVDVEVVEGDAAIGGGGAEGSFDVAVAGAVGVFAGRV